MDESYQPPIPSPFQPPAAVANAHIQKDWNNALKIVRQWAYPLTWLTIIATPLVILAIFVGEDMAHYTLPLKLIAAFICLIQFIFYIWLNRALKRGAPVAWNVQMVFSVLGLCGFPVWTFINIYILSHWSKPETKVWFRKN